MKSGFLMIVPIYAKVSSSYDEWFNAKYGNWFDDEKYGEQHRKWRGKPKIIGGNNES